MGNINYNIMRIKCPIDMKQTALERKFHKLSLHAKKANLRGNNCML